MLVTVARARANELQQQLARAQQQLEHSRALLARSATVSVLPLYGVTLSAAEPQPPQKPQTGDSATQRTFAAVVELIAQIEDATARDAGLAGRLIEDIMTAIRVVAEPSLLMGILLEGMAETVLERLPVPERRDTAIALCGLLWDRISRHESE